MVRGAAQPRLENEYGEKDEGGGRKIGAGNGGKPMKKEKGKNRGRGSPLAGRLRARQMRGHASAKKGAEKRTENERKDQRGVQKVPNRAKSSTRKGERNETSFRRSREVKHRHRERKRAGVNTREVHREDTISKKRRPNNVKRNTKTER